MIMQGICFNCNTVAAERRTFILDSEEVIENKDVCNECLSDFQELDWIGMRK